MKDAPKTPISQGGPTDAVTKFTLKTGGHTPAGDQPKAIKLLVEGVRKGMKHQTLLGVTGSGKTFTAANVIEQIGKPTLVIAHNKTLAAQLAQEYREFFPDNAVHYFVSYYDYYQPEAYMPVTDTYIEKEAMINEEIERLRHASTQALLTRKDVIIVATVSCIYGLGSPVEYEKVNMKIAQGLKTNRAELMRRFIDIHYERTNADLTPGTFRALGNSIEIMPVNERALFRIGFDVDSVSEILKIDATTRRIIGDVSAFFLFPAKHFITTDEGQKRALQTIKAELDVRLKELAAAGKNLEAERLKRRTNYDLALIREVGYCNGIENYSRHFSGLPAGAPPDTLISYFPHKAVKKAGKNGENSPSAVGNLGEPDFLTIIDESHVTIPQLGGMFAGDASRKQSLVEYGFRLPSARDNRPLKFDEIEERLGQRIYTTATPGKYELERSTAEFLVPDGKGGKIGGQIAEQVIRPTGLLDPEVVVRPIIEKRGSGPDAYAGQVFDFIAETQKEVKKGGRVIATTLTKKMAEDLSEYLKEKGIKAEYLHSEIKTIDRIQILTEFRRGKFDCLVGVNLLREGLDLPEVTFIGILDADKEGFLRSEMALIQTIGRAARNTAGRVILYADEVTGSMERAMKETARRRALQMAHNTAHGITPQTIIKAIKDITDQIQTDHAKAVKGLLAVDEAELAGVTDAREAAKIIRKLIKRKEADMEGAVKVLDFETAAILRDEVKALEEKIAGGAKAEKKERAEAAKRVTEVRNKRRA
ncbi:MAG: excinuclease ABC subunit UvrB [bacterium]